MNSESPAGPVCLRSSPLSERDAAREWREGRFREALDAYGQGRITLTEARIQARLASGRERLAYRFPRLFGSLCRLSSSDRLSPAYYAEPEPKPDGPRRRPEDFETGRGGLRLLGRGPAIGRTSGDPS